jgi:hypothetical protein
MISLMGIAGSFCTLFYIKKIGRKPLFIFGLIGSILTSVSLSVLGWLEIYDAHKYLLIAS